MDCIDLTSPSPSRTPSRGSLRSSSAPHVFVTPKTTRESAGKDCVDLTAEDSDIENTNSRMSAPRPAPPPPPPPSYFSDDEFDDGLNLATAAGGPARHLSDSNDASSVVSLGPQPPGMSARGFMVALMSSSSSESSDCVSVATAPLSEEEGLGDDSSEDDVGLSAALKRFRAQQAVGGGMCAY